MNTALVLSGSGARGAYQVGALMALSELLGNRTLPFSILVGTSSGAITSSLLAARARDFSVAVDGLADFWRRIRPQDVYRTDAATLARVGATWMVDLSSGGSVGRHRRKALLMSDPLRALLEERLDMNLVHQNIERGLVQGLALTTTSYGSGKGVTFFDAAPGVKPWVRATRSGVRHRLTLDHVMASSAIPLFFPAVQVDGTYYADGCLRSVTPLSPAIHLGADRILAIGIRWTGPEKRGDVVDAYPTVADTAGLILNAVFVEALEMDIERLERINRTLALLPESAYPAELRQVPLFVLRPSQDLGLLAKDTLSSLPLLVQYLFRGLGISGESGWDLLSYLAFDCAYTSKLLELGYADAMERGDALLKFIGHRGTAAMSQSAQ
jgi:NTE family protein